MQKDSTGSVDRFDVDICGVRDCGLTHHAHRTGHTAHPFVSYPQADVLEAALGRHLKRRDVQGRG